MTIYIVGGKIYDDTGSASVIVGDAIFQGQGGGAPASWKAAWVWRQTNVIGTGEISMYPKNAASPQRVAIGPVVQISDGAVQTTGVSVKVMPQGGAASAGGGTIAYEEGIVHYVPTQAETNYASFMLIAYKTGCIPASVTVVTTISSTAGHAGLDWANVIGPTTTVGLTNTTVGTITTYTGNTPQTGDSFARIGATGSGLTSLASQSSVNTIDDFLDTEIAAIKAKTDSLTFTTAGLVDANIQQINNVTITGDGSAGDKFDVV